MRRAAHAHRSHVALVEAGDEFGAEAGGGETGEPDEDDGGDR